MSYIPDVIIVVTVFDVLRLKLMVITSNYFSQSKSMDESKLKMFSKVYQKQALEYIIDACDDFDQATICLQNTGRTIRDFMTSLEEFTHFVLPISSSSLRKF